jgi:hypothetical protein
VDCRKQGDVRYVLLVMRTWLLCGAVVGRLGMLGMLGGLCRLERRSSAAVSGFIQTGIDRPAMPGGGGGWVGGGGGGARSTGALPPRIKPVALGWDIVQEISK